MSRLDNRKDRADWWIFSGLVFVVLVLFGQAAAFGFVSFDDPYLVVQNPQVTSGLSWKNVQWAFSSFYMSNWHPLTWLSYQADVSLFGVRPGAMHLVNVLLHAGCACLLFAVLKELTGARWRSAFVALLFAVHPLHVESVAWISERKDVLSSLFWMLTLLLYSRYARAMDRTLYILVVIAFVLGLMAKPMLVSLPFILLLLDYWPLGRWVPGKEGWKTTWPLIREKLPLVVAAVASSAVTLAAQKGATSGIGDLPFPFRAANAGLSMVRYVLSTLWPADLAYFYPHPSFGISIPLSVAALLCVAAVTWVVFRKAVSVPYLVVGWLWFVIGLGPVLGLVQVGAQAMADRYTYIPIIGLFIVVAWGGWDLAARWAWRRVVLIWTAAGVGVSLAVASYWQIQTWRDDLALFGHATRVTSGNLMAHNAYGNALFMAGHPEAAAREFRAAIALAPHKAAAYYGLGDVLNASGQKQRAMTQYRLALAMDPGYRIVRYQLAISLLELGRRRDAADQLRALLHPATPGAGTGAESGPGPSDVHFLLGSIEASTGNRPKAIEHFHAAVRANPDHVQARQKLLALTTGNDARN